MKKISLLLALMLTMCSFAACGDSDNDDDDDRKSRSSAVSDNDEDDDDNDNDDAKDDEKSVKLSRGKVNGSTYTNDSCGLSFEAPEGWHIYSEAEIKATMNAGLEVGGNTNLDTDMLMQKTTYDFVAGDLSTGESMMIMIEDLSKYPDGFTIDDYIKAAKLSTGVAMPNADIDWKIDEDHETVCGIEFDVFGLDIEIKDYDVAITQDYYLSKIDDCFLVLTYSSGYTSNTMADYKGCFGD